MYNTYVSKKRVKKVTQLKALLLIMNKTYLAYIRLCMKVYATYGYTYPGLSCIYLLHLDWVSILNTHCIYTNRKHKE